MKTDKYIIKDWAGNILNYKGYFVRPELCTEMTFDSFDDGWSWISENIHDEEAHQDLFVEPL